MLSSLNLNPVPERELLELWHAELASKKYTGLRAITLDVTLDPQPCVDTAVHWLNRA